MGEIRDTASVRTNLIAAGGAEGLSPLEASRIIDAARSDGVVTSEEVDQARAALTAFRERLAQDYNGADVADIRPDNLVRLADDQIRAGNFGPGAMDVAREDASHLRRLERLVGALEDARAEQTLWTNLWS